MGRPLFLHHASKPAAILILMVFIANCAFAADLVVRDRSVVELNDDGWSKAEKTFKSTCSGVADMPGTECYGKVPEMKGTVSSSGTYTLLAFNYQCNEKPCSYGNKCVLKQDGKLVSTFWIEGGPLAERAKVKEGYSMDALLIAGKFTATYVCEPCGHGEWAYYVEPTECKVYIYKREFDSCSKLCQSIDLNTYGDDSKGGCACYCKEDFKANVSYVQMQSRTRYNSTCTLKNPSQFPQYYEDQTYCGRGQHANMPRRHQPSRADFNLACYLHDKCYFDCKTTGMSRAGCDGAFVNDLSSECSRAKEANLAGCKSRYGSGLRFRLCQTSVQAGWLSCNSMAVVYADTVIAMGGKSFPCK